MKPSHRMQSVQSPVIAVVGEWIRRTPGTISLGQGVVNYGPPKESLDAVARFMARPEHKYCPVQGNADLIEALAAKLTRENKIGIEPDKNAIMVSAGGNMAFMNAILAIADPGDEIILPAPYYFNHEMAVTMAGARAVAVPAGENDQLLPDEIRRAITPATRAVVTVSPNNPSGAVYGAAVLREINELCRERGVYHISDEAYEYFVYDGAEHFTPASIPGADAHTISLYSFSKAYGMAGWRMGYMVAPLHLMESLKKIQDTILICPPVISQYAALGALEAGSAYCREKIIELSAVREMVRRELGAIRGVTVPRADGALYFLLKVDTKMSAMELAERLIRQFKVAVIPGETFGLNRGCHLRVAYAALQKETLREGIGRLAAGLNAL